MDGTKEMTVTCRTGSITAQHGWGYDGRTFASWQPLLPSQWNLRLKNRGYFKEVSDRVLHSSQGLEKSPQQILVCHSFGLHMLERKEIEQADLLVIISSFANFHVNDNPVSKKSIKRMIKRLTSEPRAVLQDFYAGCTGESTENASVLSDDFVKNCDVELLIADLKKLDQASLDLSKLCAAKSILLLHGVNDSIVPVEAAKQLHERLPASTLAIHEEAGHALPLSHPQWCLEQIFSERSA
jgi:pimeloyl-[acyl-carrier protein] methyl ester esterase